MPPMSETGDIPAQNASIGASSMLRAKGLGASNLRSHLAQSQILAKDDEDEMRGMDSKSIFEMDNKSINELNDNDGKSIMDNDYKSTLHTDFNSLIDSDMKSLMEIDSKSLESENEKGGLSNSNTNIMHRN